jgi:3-dehydroquinate dehydratase/shikimate dehydrogenase
MKFCISIAPSSAEEAIEKIRYASQFASLIEVRIDGMKERNLSEILRIPRPGIMITNRSVNEGGKFSGSRREYEESLLEAIACGVDFIDVEYGCGKKFFDTIFSQKKKTKVLLSYHNVQKTSSRLFEKYNAMKNFGADLMKIVSFANAITDNNIIFELLDTAKKEKQKLAAFCMGECGQISRILGRKYGSSLIFAALNEKEITAPAQLPLQQLYDVFRADTISSRTKVFGLLGNPVAHSKGIYFHNEIFTRKKINAVYVNYLVHHLDVFWETFQNSFSGLSITMPFKEKIIPYLDSIDSIAQQIGAVNTVIKRKMNYCGMNTDYMAINSLLRAQFALRKKNILVLGTGGTAKMMAFVGVNNNACVTVLGRNKEKLQLIADAFNCNVDTIEHIENYSPDIVMNGTSIGMLTNEVKRIVSEKFLQTKMLVVDAVYAPELTPLVIAAKEKGCKVITGRKIFEKQAQLQSQIFLDSLQ